MATDATQPVTAKPAASVAPATTSRWALTREQMRIAAIGAGAILLVVLVGWFIVAAGKRKESFATRALEDARLIAGQGDLGRAAQQYTRVIDSYRGTTAANEAVLGLAQVRLIISQNELAISALTDFLKTNPPATYAGPANGLLGTAYENLGKFPEALAAHKKASEAATVDYLKATALLDAGRAARLAGKKDEAMAIYREILKKYGTTASKTEAEVRLAELTAGKP